MNNLKWGLTALLATTVFSTFVEPVRAGAANDIPLALKWISNSDPLVCAGPANEELAGHSVCTGDVGSFQLARLGLAIESFASALSTAGIKDAPNDIQNELYSDIVKFGIHDAIILPAMSLVDTASMKNSPFSSKSDIVFGKSLIALEYLVPETIGRLNYSNKNIGKMADQRNMAGPNNFTQFFKEFGSRGTSIDEYRIFARPTDTSLLLGKLDSSKLNVPHHQNRNSIRDFYFDGGLNLQNRRGIPFASGFAQVTAIAQATNSPLDESLFPLSENPNGREYLSNTPFQGASCKMCRDTDQVLPAKRSPDPLISGGMLIGSIESIRSSPSVHQGKVNTGDSFISATREGTTQAARNSRATTANNRQNNNIDIFCPVTCGVETIVKKTIPPTVMIYREVMDDKKLKNRNNEIEDIEKDITKLFKKIRENLRKNHYSECKKECQKERNKLKEKETKEKKHEPQITPKKKIEIKVTNASTKERQPTEKDFNSCPFPKRPDCACAVNAAGEVKKCAQLDIGHLDKQDFVTDWFILNTRPTEPREVLGLFATYGGDDRTSEITMFHDDKSVTLQLRRYDIDNSSNKDLAMEYTNLPGLVDSEILYNLDVGPNQNGGIYRFSPELNIFE